MGLTIKPIDNHGKVDIEDTLGKHMGFGRARMSNTVDGYMTIQMPFPPYMIRVPASWLDELQKLREATSE